ATQEQIVHVPAFTVKPVDTTGAGDAFMGGLSYGLLQKWDLERVGTFANACAALCCTKVGARAMSKYNEVLAFIRAQRPSAAASM
ncbi:MAG: carbohydrate kinase family protein, partial [Candidatus Acidiferrales bacterium]